MAQVPPGRVVTCGALARALGDVAASRAVARMVSREQVGGPIHRVVRADGSAVWGGALPRLWEEGVGDSGGRVRKEAFLSEDALSGSPILKALREEQFALRKELRVGDEAGSVERVGGVDVAYEEDRAFAACVAMDPEGSRVLEEADASCDVAFPYIPGYLAYREGAAIAAVLREVRDPPDLLLVDAHGIAHPAGFGLACHVGVVEGLRTIGVAKSLLAGALRGQPTRPLDASEILIEGEVKGYALRPATGKRLLYISPGHRVGLETSLDTVRGLVVGPQPEPLRRAHRLAAEERGQASNASRS